MSMLPFLVCLALATWQELDTHARQLLREGDLAGAEAQWREAIDLADKSAQIEPGVVTCLTGLSLVAEQRGDTSESERLYELGMRNIEASLGRQSRQFVDYMPNLGLLYQKHGKIVQAEALFQEFLQSCEKNFGRTSIETARGFDVYAEYLHRAGREVESLSAAQEAKTIRAKLRTDEQ